MNVVWLGKMAYDCALHLQERVHKLRIENKIEDILLLVEHNPVITIGKSGTTSNIYLSQEELSRNNVDVFNVNRGGDVTYHGPGQLVGYPIINLKGYNKDLRSFVKRIGHTVIHFLNDEFNINAVIDEGKLTGVWIGDDKITAIGLSAKKWVTMHGFALNLSTDLQHFSWINPCGLTDKGVTSVEAVIGRKIECEEVVGHFSQIFCEVFNQDEHILSLNDFLEIIDQLEKSIDH